MMLQAIIFTTGGAILALELLASRIMTPYFGVSLFIWSGILSITLVSLALGYWWGGRLAAGRNGHALSAEKLASLFTLMPAVASATRSWVWVSVMGLSFAWMRGERDQSLGPRPAS